MWVSATLRSVNTQGGFGAVINKGERESGSLVLRLNLLDQGQMPGMQIPHCRHQGHGFTRRAPSRTQLVQFGQVMNKLHPNPCVGCG